METYFLKNEDLFKFYDRIARDYELYVPAKGENPLKAKCSCPGLPTDNYILRKYSEVKKEDICFNDYRAIEPAARAFFTHFKEKVCSYFTDSPKKEKPMAISGVKNCDLFSAKIQDFVFLGGNEEDSIYKERRTSALIIAGDCPNFKEVCFCRAFDINPYAEADFDFNFSPLNNGYLLDVGSVRAKVIADSLKEILVPATLGQISGRKSKREAANKRLDEHLANQKIPKKDTLKDIVLSGYNSKIWQEQMQTCVECAGCIFICDTCHCFLLTDEAKGENVERIRVWDGCLVKNFSKVAGGANPLKLRYQRLRNRYLKKFDFFVDNIGFQACCGCGRCIEVCPGKIDIRVILRKLYEEKYLPAS